MTALALAAVFGVPAAAAAYTPASSGDQVTLAAGARETFRFDELTPRATVRISLTGADVTPATLASARVAATTVTRTKTSTAAGTVDVTVTVPETAEGSYRLVVRDGVTGAEEELVLHAAVTFAGTIPVAGFDGDSLLGVWAGGGALVLAGAGIAAATSVRRARGAAR